ncbi:MAG: 16S rRNA (cytidine(1402)-2'-O)-methyltransferase [Bacteroidota bacterium]|nr:16S rRNA (cytidine(1402)-2'-O)-methyltransferase [Bacteroidota bacterium]
MNGTLYLVASPIGNYDDITFRALRILKESDVIVYEERREGERLLSRYDISEKSIELLNEHNEKEISIQIIDYLKDGKQVAIISDAGTPVFSDPGQFLVKKAIEQNINIVPIPGPSSLIPALVLSGFPIHEFLFYGFLSPKREERMKELIVLRDEYRTVAFMETPYRLLPLLKDFVEVFGNDRRVVIAFNLTMPDEQIFRGTPLELYEKFEKNKIKGEFVVLVAGSKKIKVKNNKW